MKFVGKKSITSLSGDYRDLRRSLSRENAYLYIGFLSKCPQRERERGLQASGWLTWGKETGERARVLQSLMIALCQRKIL